MRAGTLTQTPHNSERVRVRVCLCSGGGGIFEHTHTLTHIHVQRVILLGRAFVPPRSVLEFKVGWLSSRERVRSDMLSWVFVVCVAGRRGLRARARIDLFQHMCMGFCLI